jgi:hypothetical protein
VIIPDQKVDLPDGQRISLEIVPSDADTAKAVPGSNSIWQDLATLSGVIKDEHFEQAQFKAILR